MTFDDVLPELVATCEQWASWDKIKKIVVVRDLRGRIRLVIDVAEDVDGDRLGDRLKLLFDQLGEQLKLRVGDWFTGEILLTHAGPAPLRGVAEKILKMSGTVPLFEGAQTGRSSSPERWLKLERRMGKFPWLDGAFQPPWPCTDGSPTVVTFYSFKGGVGRTTALAACAIQAAQAGERVAILDLDLEAPGLGSLLGVERGPGVLDILVDHLATGQIEHGGQPPANLPGALAELADRIEVFHAGSLDSRFLEKLSRLDFSSTLSGDSPSEMPARKALLALLDHLKSSGDPPRWILLDSRAGLHDLAGLSLHGLAHIDVIFSRANQQGLAGLDLVLSTLARRHPADLDERLLLIHAMAPPSIEESNRARTQMQEQTHGMFQRHGLFRGRVPESNSSDGIHRPWSIRQNSLIESNLGNMEELVQHLSSGDFSGVWAQIKAQRDALASRGP